MTLRELLFSLGYQVDKSSETKAEKSIKSLKSMATTLLGAIGIGFSISGIMGLAEAAADVEAIKSQFSQVFGEVEADAQSKLNKIADDTGVNANRMKSSFTQIAAFAKTTGMEEADALGIADRAMQAVADSAAFYDNSIENTTESLQSFLKGNYANDAALGLSCTETTRNAAANKLYGKSFADLAEDQKQLTLLSMVEDANKASGALGQAARESDTWTNQLGNMKQAAQDLKATIGSTFLKPAVSVLKVGTALLQKATEKINTLSQDPKLIRKVKEVKTVLQKVGDGIQKGIKIVNNIVDKMGGWEKVLRVVAIAAGILITAMNWKKITDGIKSVTKLLNPAALKMMAIVAVVLILAAVIDDFINFLQGNDSVFGELLGKAGIDADAAREKIIGALTFIKNTAVTVFQAIKQFIVDHKAQILGIIGAIGKVIAVIIAIVAIVKTVIAVFTIVKGVIAAVGAVIAFLTSPIGIVIAIIAALIAIGVLLYKNWDTIKEKAGELFEGIKEKFNSIVEWFKGLPENAKQWMHDFVQGLIDGIKDKISDFTDTVSGIGEKIKSFLHFSTPDEGPLTDYESWMPDMMTGLANGIKNNMPLLKKAVSDASSLLSTMGNVSVNGKTASNAVGGSSKTNNVNQTNIYNTKVTGTDTQAVNKAATTISESGNDNTGELARALAFGR